MGRPVVGREASLVSSMIVANLWFINHSNGLFHYGLDYVSMLGGHVREVWTRNAEMAIVARQRLPGIEVRVLRAGDILSGLFRVRRRRDLLFTPSSHPLALVPRQVVVVHDSFPFQGRQGAIKLALFRAGLAFSGASAGYINRADGHCFLARLGLKEARMHYLPNRIPPWNEGRRSCPITLNDQIVVGLFGSDSPKKNYHKLFATFEAARDPDSLPVIWRIYGHANAYTDQLCATFPNLAIEIVSSDASTMTDFFGSIDLAVSGAEGEGFARPIASALMLGIPTMLLDTPVFREFYALSAELFGTVEALTKAIAVLRSGQQLTRPNLANEAALRSDFGRAVALLESI